MNMTADECIAEMNAIADARLAIDRKAADYFEQSQRLADREVAVRIRFDAVHWANLVRDHQHAAQERTRNANNIADHMSRTADIYRTGLHAIADAVRSVGVEIVKEIRKS